MGELRSLDAVLIEEGTGNGVYLSGVVVFVWARASAGRDRRIPRDHIQLLSLHNQKELLLPAAIY